MIKLMVGNNFDKVFVQALINLNKKYKSDLIQISEVFGSIRALNDVQTARPDFRVPDIAINDFKYINDMLFDNGIKINYTINTPIVDHKKINEKTIEIFINKLKEYHVGRVTVAHPLLMKIISKVSDMPIEISTIYRVRHPRQLYDLKELAPNVNKLCADVYANRDKFLLEELKTYCDDLKMELELLANEFCIQHCAVRDQCYHAHVMNKTFDDTLYFNHWPMGYCISHREQNPKEWLLANFVLPQHMKIYDELFRITHFKVTGRTAPTKYLTWVIEEYLKSDFKGNLLMLWQDVKNLGRVSKGHQDFLPPKYEIDASKLDFEFLLFYLTCTKPITFQQEKLHIDKYINNCLIQK